MIAPFKAKRFNMDMDKSRGNVNIPFQGFGSEIAVGTLEGGLVAVDGKILLVCLKRRLAAVGLLQM